MELSLYVHLRETGDREEAPYLCDKFDTDHVLALSIDPGLAGTVKNELSEAPLRENYRNGNSQEPFYSIRGREVIVYFDNGVPISLAPNVFG